MVTNVVIITATILAFASGQQVAARPYKRRPHIQALELAFLILVIQFGELNQVAKQYTTAVTEEGV